MCDASATAPAATSLASDTPSAAHLHSRSPSPSSATLACGEFPSTLGRLTKFNVRPVCVQHDSHNPPTTRALAALPKNLDLALLGLSDDVHPPASRATSPSCCGRTRARAARCSRCRARRPSSTSSGHPPSLTSGAAATPRRRPERRASPVDHAQLPAADAARAGGVQGQRRELVRHALRGAPLLGAVAAAAGRDVRHARPAPPPRRCRAARRRRPRHAGGPRSPPRKPQRPGGDGRPPPRPCSAAPSPLAPPSPAEIEIVAVVSASSPRSVAAPRRLGAAPRANWNATGCEPRCRRGVADAASLRLAAAAGGAAASRSFVGRRPLARRGVPRGGADRAAPVVALGDSITCGHRCAGRALRRCRVCAWPTRLQTHSRPSRRHAADAADGGSATAGRRLAQRRRDASAGASRARRRRGKDTAQLVRPGLDAGAGSREALPPQGASSRHRAARRRRAVARRRRRRRLHGQRRARWRPPLRRQRLAAARDDDEQLIRRRLALPSRPALVAAESFMSLGYWDTAQISYVESARHATASKARVRRDDAAPRLGDHAVVPSGIPSSPPTTSSPQSRTTRRRLPPSKMTRGARARAGSLTLRDGARGAAASVFAPRSSRRRRRRRAAASAAVVVGQGRYFAASCIHPAWWTHQLYAEVIAYNWWVERASRSPAAAALLAARATPLRCRGRSSRARGDLLCRTFATYMSANHGARARAQWRGRSRTPAGAVLGWRYGG